MAKRLDVVAHPTITEQLLESAGVALLKAQRLAREQGNEELRAIVRSWISESQEIQGKEQPNQKEEAE